MIQPIINSRSSIVVRSSSNQNIQQIDRYNLIIVENECDILRNSCCSIINLNSYHYNHVQYYQMRNEKY